MYIYICMYIYTYMNNNRICLYHHPPHLTTNIAIHNSGYCCNLYTHTHPNLGWLIILQYKACVTTMNCSPTALLFRDDLKGRILRFSENRKKYTTGWWYTYPSETYETYEFANWDDDIPNRWANRKCNHQPDNNHWSHFRTSFFVPLFIIF